MDHSTAILDDASAAIGKSAAAASTGAEPRAEDSKISNGPEGDANETSGQNERKRKGDFPDYSVRHGSRGRGGKDRGGYKGGRGSDTKRHKKGDLGRADYLYEWLDFITEMAERITD